MSLSDDADYPDCPNCGTNVLVAKDTDPDRDWQCYGCGESFPDPRPDQSPWGWGK